MKRSILAFLMLGTLIMIPACATTADANKDYTIKTEKWSRASRDKFYRIVKVPKTPACDATKGTCPE